MSGAHRHATTETAGGPPMATATAVHSDADVHGEHSHSEAKEARATGSAWPVAPSDLPMYPSSSQTRCFQVDASSSGYLGCVAISVDVHASVRP